MLSDSLIPMDPIANVWEVSSLSKTEPRHVQPSLTDTGLLEISVNNPVLVNHYDTFEVH